MPFAFLHTHVLVVVLFLLLYLAKALLLLLNKHHTLAKVKKSTKMLDMIFGGLALITGGYLLFTYAGAIPGWLIVKLVLVLLAIPMGIVGMKRNNKVLTILTLLLFVYVYGVAETKSLAMNPEGAATSTNIIIPSPVMDASEAGEPHKSSSPDKPEEEIISALSENSIANTKAIYVTVCANCHGQSGDIGLGGATNLKDSALNLNERKHVIANGRGRMPGFGKQLSNQEVEALAAYTMKLKNS